MRLHEAMRSRTMAEAVAPVQAPAKASHADDGLDLLRKSAKSAHGARKALYEKALKRGVSDK